MLSAFQIPDYNLFHRITIDKDYEFLKINI